MKLEQLVVTMLCSPAPGPTPWSVRATLAYADDNGDSHEARLSLQAQTRIELLERVFAWAREQGPSA